MNPLFSIILFCDTFTPILIWKAGFPAAIRWLSHLCIALMIVSVLLRAQGENIGRKVLLFVLFLTSIGVLVALVNRQSILATLWGWWLLFKGPFIGIYAYLFSKSYKNYENKIVNWCFTLVIVLFIAQLFQYFSGEPPGDHLSGTLGRFATGHLILILLFSLAMMFGHWIAKGKLVGLILLMAIGVVSSALAELKIYFFLAPLFAILSVILVFWLKKSINIKKALIVMLLIAVGLWSFPIIYNKIVPGVTFVSILNESSFTKWAQYSAYSEEHGWDIGRNYGVQYVWNRINKDYIKLGLGEGLGSRGVSKSFSVSGIGTQGEIDNYAGTSLVVILGEFGLFGIAILLILIASISYKLLNGLRYIRNPNVARIQIGLIIYTIFSPLLLWYTSAWTMSIPSLLYWTSLGYIFSYSRKEKRSHRKLEPDF